MAGQLRQTFKNHFHRPNKKQPLTSIEKDQNDIIPPPKPKHERVIIPSSMRVTDLVYPEIDPIFPVLRPPTGGRIKTYIYFHIYTDGVDHMKIVAGIMNKIWSSGLLDEIDEVRYYIIGVNDIEEMKKLMSFYPKTVFRRHDKDATKYERFTLHALHKDAVESREDARVLYVHSKGTSKKSREYPGIGLWTESMIETLARYRRVCWEWMERGVDTVGIMYVDYPKYHYSGNFWWSSFRHIRRLYTPIPDRYLDPEMWVTSHPRTWAISLSQMGGEMYHTPPTLKERLSSIAISHHRPRKDSNEFSISSLVEDDLIDTVEMSLDSISWIRLHPRQLMDLPPSDIIRIIKIHTKDGRVRFLLENEIQRAPCEVSEVDSEIIS